jgi:hypothetical protein
MTRIHRKIRDSKYSCLRRQIRLDKFSFLYRHGTIPPPNPPFITFTCPECKSLSVCLSSVPPSMFSTCLICCCSLPQKAVRQRYVSTMPKLEIALKTFLNRTEMFNSLLFLWGPPYLQAKRCMPRRIHVYQADVKHRVHRYK